MSVLVPLALAMAAALLRAHTIRVEGFTSNLAVGQASPLIEWQVKGGMQGGYQVQVRGDGVAYDTQPVPSARPFHEVAAELKPRADYQVRVRLFDRAMTPGPWSPYQPFRTLRLDKRWAAKWIHAEGTSAPFRAAANGYHSALVADANHEKWVEVDLGQSQEIDRVTLYPAQPIDWNPPTPGLMFPLVFRIEVDGTKVFEQAEELPQQASPWTARFAPVKGRVVRLVCTKLRARNPGNFALALAEMAVGNPSGQVVSVGAQARALDSIENSNWGIKRLTDGDLESHPASGIDALPAHYLRRQFDLERVPKRVLMHIAVLGAYQLYVNGKRMDRHALSPDWTDYFERVGVQTFDIAKALRPGKNVIGIIAGDGWYAGRIGMSQALHPEGRPRGVYGRIPLVRAEVELPGESLLTDERWMATRNGPIRASDHLDGEFYDATMELKDWATVSATMWPPAQVGRPIREPALDVQTAEPITVTQRVKPVSRALDPKGRVVLDFGQNLVGRAKFKLRGRRGERVVVRYAEMLNDDGSAYFANLRGAPSIDTFVLDGSNRWYTTHFTYHGFRYASLDFGDQAPHLSQAEAEVFHTAAPETAAFACSNPMLERLWQNVVWTQRANLMSTPTDCPQRDERLGWMGDIHAYAQTATYIMDMRNFWRKWHVDVRDAQAADGRFPDFAPQPYGKDRHFTGVPGWGDAGVITPHSAYRNYEDLREVRRMMPAIARYLAWVESKNPNYLWEKDRHNDYGDWLNGDTLIQEGWPKQGAECPKDVFATLMWFQSASAAAEMAEALPSPAEASTFRTQAEKIRRAFLAAYVSADGKIKGDTQAGYAIALGLDILPEDRRAAAFGHLVAAVERANYHITTGFHSTHHLMQVLTRFGRSDLAYRLILNRTFPSWGYSIEQGATTIWERWDGYVKGRGFQDPGMNSFNHWAFGSVGEWMMEAIIGIRPGEPGWRKFRIRPEVGGGLTWAKGRFDAPPGRIAVAWSVADDRLTIQVEVPDGTEAEFTPPPGWIGRALTLPAGRHEIRLNRE